MIGKNTSSLPPIVPPTTNALPPETTQQLTSVSSDGVTYTFRPNDPCAGSGCAGRDHGGRPSNAAPDGFLRRVTAVNTSGGQVVVQTQAATLEDAIQQGEVNISKRLTPADIKSMSALPGCDVGQAGGDDAGG